MSTNASGDVEKTVVKVTDNTVKAQSQVADGVEAHHTHTKAKNKRKPRKHKHAAAKQGNADEMA